MTGLGRWMIYQLEAERRFPCRVRIGARAVGWGQFGSTGLARGARPAPIAATPGPCLSRRLLPTASEQALVHLSGAAVPGTSMALATTCTAHSALYIEFDGCKRRAVRLQPDSGMPPRIATGSLLALVSLHGVAVAGLRVHGAA